MEQENLQQEQEIYHLDTRTALAEHLFTKRETGFRHAPFEREIAFYESVRSGNLETVKTLFTPLGGEGFGTLSHDPVQNLKYHLVVSIAMITRFCINGGMQPEDAYSLSDIYILRTDGCTSEDAIRDVHYEMTVTFTKRMRQINSGKKYTKTMLSVLDYISDHLHERILIDDLAESVSRTAPYLSRMFRKEMGIPLSEYIIRKKIEAAANMLQFSDFTALDISNYLGFSSQSYFIKLFRRQIGLTPKEYRNRFYTVGFMKPSFMKTK
ncbi:MAG: helix-turn-helix transcriptional regulator [Oscillospiraceae bacterium]|nr:helix-turn-helix transcriptional regulator [Oscillospiraceae bacterium]